MSIKYKVSICISILAVLFGAYGFDDSETVTLEPNPSPVKTGRNTARVDQQVENEAMVAAILIMPKSYLPALKRFSQSPMAKDIKILRAQLEEIDGKLTAVQQTKYLKPKIRSDEPPIKPDDTDPRAIPSLPQGSEKQLVSAGFLYLLASIHPIRMTP